jgi:hypothetical protein
VVCDNGARFARRDWDRVDVLVEGECTLRLGLLRRGCGREAVGQCVYCGEPFCDAHGEQLEDYLEVCHRGTCREKREDVLRHQQWMLAVSPANRHSICAHEECQTRMAHQCQRCRLQFCSEHLVERAITEMQLTGETRCLRVLICLHCADRRKLWD